MRTFPIVLPVHSGMAELYSNEGRSLDCLGKIASENREFHKLRLPKACDRGKEMTAGLKFLRPAVVSRRGAAQRPTPSGDKCKWLTKVDEVRVQQVTQYVSLYSCL
jgi:hypothetical protein